MLSRTILQVEITVSLKTANLSKNLFKSLLVIWNNSNLHLIKFNKSCFQPPLLLAHWAHVSALFDCSPVHEFNERYSIYSWRDLAKLIYNSILLRMWLLNIDYINHLKAHRALMSIKYFIRFKPNY